MINCIWNCLKNIPWWAWLVLVVAGVIIALLTFFLAPAMVIASTTIPAWITAAIAGLGPVGITILNCIRKCKG